MVADVSTVRSFAGAIQSVNALLHVQLLAPHNGRKLFIYIYCYCYYYLISLHPIFAISVLGRWSMLVGAGGACGAIAAAARRRPLHTTCAMLACTISRSTNTEIAIITSAKLDASPFAVMSQVIAVP